MNKHHGSTLESFFEELGELDELRLRTLVKTTLLEDEQLLKKWALADEDNPIEQELAKLDIVPIHRGQNNTSLLGEGMFNRALDVVYKGKRAVARFSRKRKELEQMLYFVSYEENLDPKYAKHFPKLYLTFDFTTDHAVYYGVVVELLEPIPPALKFEIDHMSLNDNLQSSRVQIVLEDPSLVVDWAREASPYNEGMQDHLVDLFEAEVRPFLIKMVGSSLFDVEKGLDAIMRSAKERTGSGTSVHKQFWKKLFDALRGEVIPNGADDNGKMAERHVSRAVREFYDFLLKLQEAGMTWSDLHTDNFMMRKSTGDLVVVDPGLFK